MTFRYGRGWVFDEANGENDGAGGGGDGADAGEGKGDGSQEVDAGDGGGEGGDGAGAAGGTAGAAKKESAPKDMKEAIDQGLGYTKPAGEAKDEKKDGKPAAGAEGKETATHHANGKPKQDDKGNALDADGKPAQKTAAKVKSSAELALKPEELKLLGAKTGQRFTEMITALKTHEGTLAKQGDQIKVLTEARDSILGVMEETKTTPDQLTGYLHFNSLLQSNKAEDLESALEMVEAQRLGLYKALGREPEGGGVDLLKDFPDLVKQVDDEEITRAAALEIAKGRRERQGRERVVQQQQQQQRQQQTSAEQQKKIGDKALKDIHAWTAGLAKSDLDYIAKEDRLLAKLDEVLQNYPPDKWLSTLKLLYEGIEIPKAAPAGGDPRNRPLRPSGAKPGAKAPTTMLEAINQGLGYAGKED